MIHEGDVDLKSGNLRFKGDLEVVGNIVEGMAVECWGNLYVQGNVAGASLLCGGSARFDDNLINSSITVGIFQDIYSGLHTHLKELEDTLINFFRGIEQTEKAFYDRGKEVQAERVGLIKLFFELKLTISCNYAVKCKTLEKYKFTLPSFLKNNLREVCQYFIGRISWDYRKRKAPCFSIKSQLSGLTQNGRSPESDLPLYKTAGSLQWKYHCYWNRRYNSEFSPQSIILKVFSRGGINAGKTSMWRSRFTGFTVKQGQILLNPDSTAASRYIRTCRFFGSMPINFQD